VGHGGADGEEWNVRGVEEVGILERPFLVRGEIAVDSSGSPERVMRLRASAPIVIELKRALRA